MKNYVSLHTHTTFSLLDGISKRDELIKLTKEYGMPGLALTEHGNLFNCISFYREAVKAGIVPIIGYEAYVAPDSRLNRSYAKHGEAEEDAKNGDLTLYAYHLTVLAKNREGYDNLKMLSTLAYKEGFYRKPRVDDELLERHKDGLIVLSGCLAGKVARYIIAGNKKAAIEEIDKLRFRHGENFYLELMAHNMDEERIVREALLDVSKTHGIPTVMTGDSHFTHHGDELAHTVALNMGTGRTLTSEDKWTFNGSGYWYKKPDEMHEIAAGAGIPEESLSNTVNICKSIEDYGFKLASKTKKFVVPLFREEDHIYTDEECNQLLEYKAWEGMALRGLSDSEQHRNRLTEELAMMKSKNFSSYFLIISDIVEFMRREGIIVPIGRGSSLGSLVCYVLYVTGLDPVEHTIPFERFINEGRKDLPDVDTDISQENRGRVLQYIAKKYGHDRVAHIVTFQSLRPKAAIDNVGRVLDVPHGIRKQATADIHDDPTSADTLVELVEATPTTKKIIDQIPNWYDIAVKLEGNNRNLGSHAAGIVISNSSLLDAGVPLMRDAEDGISTTQLDMEDMAELGLLKLDMLGLKNMDVIAKTLEQVETRYGIKIDWHHIPLDDAHTYDTIYTGKYVSVFQYDSSGMRNLARQLRPENFDHLVAINCLYRPGPMKKPQDGGQSILEMYLDRRHGRAKVENWHPELEPIFRPTLGLCIEENQLVTRSDGSKVKIKDVGVGDSLLSINSSSNTVARKTFTGTKECVKINTKYGASLICSIDHPIMVNMKQIAAGDIKVGDFVHKPYITLPMNECDLTEDQAYCIGLLLGDGSINASTPTIALGNDQTWHDQVETSFTSAWPEILPHKYHNCRSFYFSLGMAANRADESNVANVISRCLTDLGIRQSTCKNKFIPDKIKYSNDKTRLATLAGLWDSDGTVSSTVCYTSASKSLIRDVDEILSHLRISHYIGKHQNRIYIRDVSKFMEIVPLRHHAKIKAGTMNARYLRVSRSHLIADMASSGLKKRQYARKLKISRSSISKASLDKYCTVHLSNKFDAGIKKFYYDDHDSDMVTSIESVGRRSVYDLTMTDSSRPWFTAGDILVHNCLFQEQLMGLAQTISGFNKVEADEYRAAVGKKDREKFLAAQDKLIQRGITIGRDPKFMKDLADKVAGFARYGWNKGHACLRTGTKVLTCDRGLVEIQDIKPGEELWSIRHDTGDLFRNRVVNLFNNGIKRIVRIKAGGSTLECTGDHRLLSSEKLYKDANQFLPGDRLQMLDERINRANLNIGVTSLTDRDQIPLWVSSDDLERYNVMDLERARGVAYRTDTSISGNDFVGNRKLDFLPIRPTDGFVPPTIFKDRSRANVDSTLGEPPSDGQLTSDPVSGDDFFNHLSYFRGNCIGPIAANSPFLETTGQTGASSFKRESCHNLLGSIAFEPQANNKIFVDLERVNLNKTPVTGSASSPLSDSYGKSAYFARDLFSIVANKTSATVGFDDIGIRTELGTTSNTNIIDHTKIIHDWNVDSNVDTGEDDVVWDLEMEQDPNFIANGFVVHNCAYSYISYVTAWLETHYPHEYYTSLLNTADDDTKKLSVLISAILQRGVKLLPPDINKSSAEFTTDGKAIYMGLYSIKQVGEGAVRDILADRQANGAYPDYMGFNCRLVKSRLVNRTVKENLVKAGAFNWDTSLTAKDKIANTEKIQDGFKKYLDKLGLLATQAKINEKILVTGKEFSPAHLLELEKSALNFYISSHPVLHFCKTFRLFPNANFILPNQLQETTSGDTILLCGLVTKKEVKPTSNGSLYLAMTISDNAVDVKTRVWSPLGPQVAQNIAEGQIVIAVGTAVPDNFVPTEMSIKVKKVIPIQANTGIPINGIWAKDEPDLYVAANILGAQIGTVESKPGYYIGHLNAKGYIKPEVVENLPTYKVGYSLDI